MKNLEMENYGVEELNEMEANNIDGGKWWGLLVGAVGGFLVGGPVGMIAGGIAGDILSDQTGSVKGGSYSAPIN